MTHFFNCDWGTSHFRLRVVERETARILAERRSDEGVARFAEIASELRGTSFRGVLLKHMEALQLELDIDLQDSPVLISGMASSTMGWEELPYARLPFSLLHDELPSVRVQSASSHPVYLFTGLRSDTDIMRGEEVELVGWSTLVPDLMSSNEKICVILPGTHSKHVFIHNGTVVSFQTHLTGELYLLLSQRSSLKHSRGTMQWSTTEPQFRHQTWKEVFQEGVELIRRQGLSTSLFQVRARQILRGESPGESGAFLSGLLTGNELQGFLREQEQYERIVLLASGELQALYLAAFEQLNLLDRVETVPAEDVNRLTALGQIHLSRQFEQEQAFRAV